MKTTIKSVLQTCCFLSVIFYACTKNGDSNNSSKSQETQTTSDNMLAQSINDDITSLSSQSEDNGVAGTISDSTHGLLFSSCVSISINTVSSPHQLIIDFGNSNCLCFDGKYRRGKILIAFTGWYRDAASTHTITFDNYYVNNYKVEGTQTVVNNGRNAAGNLSFSINVNSTITDTAGKKLTYTSERIREWAQGENTKGLFGWKDDVYSITGEASGTDFQGSSYTANITSPLIAAMNCRWIEAGKFDFTPGDNYTRTIDFGNGGCDNKATVSIGNLSVNISLP